MNLKARINAVGDPDLRKSRAGAMVCRVDCAGCGEDIWSDQDLSGIQYVKTKKRYGAVYPRRLYPESVGEG